MRTGTLVALALLGSATLASAQVYNPACAPNDLPLLEVRPVVGALVPTGAQRDVFGTAATYGVQVAMEINPRLHVQGSFAWSPNESKLDLVDADVDVFHYDLGAEFNLIRPLAGGWDLKPFVGFGAGARTYRYAADAVPGHSPLTVYGAAGTELQYGVAALRLEVRDYAYSFRHPITDASKTRNELGLGLGIAYHFGSW